jgi:hypothetical protein
MTPNDVVFTLDEGELRLLLAATGLWFGAATPSDLQVRAMGFDDLSDLRDHGEDFFERLAPECSFSPLEWTQLLMMAELGFASDIQGAGWEWSVITGIRDEDAIRSLRALQHRLISIRLFRGRDLEPFVAPREGE